MNLFRFFILSILTCQIGWADPIDIFCPTPAEIKEGNFHGWLPLDNESEKLASAVDVAKFREHVQRFKIARWNTAYFKSAHCFYSGDDEILEKITFARDVWRPFATVRWKWLSNKSAECAAGSARECGFVSDGK